MMDVRLLISAVDDASKIMAKVTRNAGLMVKGLAMQQTGQSLATVGRGMQSLADPIRGAMQTAMGLESVMADVNKVLGAEEVAAAGVGKGLMQMSRRIPTSVEGLAAISAAGGSLGLTAKEVLGFTEVAAKMGIAFDMSADRAGVAIAKLRNVFSLDTKGGVKEVQALGDTINALENDMSLNAADAVEAMTRIGGTTRTFGLSADQAAALASSIIALGNAPDVAATAINSILPSLQTATGGTRAFKEGLLMTGISAEQMSQMVKKDGMGAINALLQSLQRLDPEGRALAIKKMFGAGADARALGTLANDAGQLTKALSIINDKTKKAGSMQREFESRSNTTANSMQLLQNNMAEIAITVGSVLLPALNSVVKTIMPIVQGVAAFAEANPMLTKIGASALVAVAGFGAIIVATGTMISFIGSAIAGFGTLAGAWAATSAGVTTGAAWVASVGGIGAIAASVGTVITTALGAAAAAVGALGLPFIAVAAVIAGAAFLVVRHWKPISAFFANLLNDPITTLKNAASSLGSMFMNLGRSIASPFAWAFEQVTGLWRNIGVALAPVGGMIRQLFTTWLDNAIAPYRFAFGFIVGLFQGLSGAIAGSLGQGLGSVAGQINATIGTMTASVKGGFNALGAGISGFVAGLSGAFLPIVTAIQGAFSSAAGIVSGTMQAITGLVSGFTGGILTTIDGIAGGISSITGGIASAVGAALGQVINAVSGIIAKVRQIPQAFLGIGHQILASINAIASQMFSAGANIIGQLIGGIQSKIGEATTAMSNAVGQMRNYLPFSPAKVGPLADLDQIDFMGTVAQNITPAPLTSAIQTAMNAVQGVLGSEVTMPPVAQVLSAIAPTGTVAQQMTPGVPAIAPTGTTLGMATEGSAGVASSAATIPVTSQGGGLQVDASVSVVINGDPGTPQAQESLRSQLEAHQATIIRIMEQHARNQRRTSYS